MQIKYPLSAYQRTWGMRTRYRDHNVLLFCPLFCIYTLFWTKGRKWKNIFFSMSWINKAKEVNNDKSILLKDHRTSHSRVWSCRDHITQLHSNEGWKAAAKLFVFMLTRHMYINMTRKTTSRQTTDTDRARHSTGSFTQLFTPFMDSPSVHGESIIGTWTFY